MTNAQTYGIKYRINYITSGVKKKLEVTAKNTEDAEGNAELSLSAMYPNDTFNILTIEKDSTNNTMKPELSKPFAVTFGDEVHICFDSEEFPYILSLIGDVHTLRGLPDGEFEFTPTTGPNQKPFILTSKELSDDPYGWVRKFGGDNTAIETLDSIADLLVEDTKRLCLKYCVRVLKAFHYTTK